VESIRALTGTVNVDLELRDLCRRPSPVVDIKGKPLRRERERKARERRGFAD
jgi:hypothetical protein